MKKGNRIVEKLSLPQDIIYGELCAQLLGNKEIWIENYQGIVTVSDDHIILSGKNTRIAIEGKELYIAYFTKEEMKVTGIIERISFGV